MTSYPFLRLWFVFVIFATIMCGLIFTSAQQVLRMNANDPQIQMAQDAARALENGASPRDVVSENVVDIRYSLSPYVIVFTEDGTATSSSATAGKSEIALPVGVFDYVRQHGESRITWQPQSDVRVAAVIVRVTGKNAGFVLAGRSLLEIEDRINIIFTQTIIAWLFINVVILIALFILKPRQKKIKTPEVPTFVHEPFVSPQEPPTYNLS